MAAPRFTATYRIQSDAASIEARAQSIAVEQSVEMPVSAIVEAEILRDIVGQVEAIEDRGDGRLRRPHRPCQRDRRARCRSVPQHGVRQHLAACGCRAARRGDSRRSRRGVRRPAPRHRRPPPSRRRVRPCAHLLGAEAAGRAAGAAGATGGAVRPRRHRLHQGRPRPGGPGLLAVRRPRRRDRRQRRHARATCPACPAISTRCAARSTSRARTGSTRSWSRRCSPAGRRCRRWCGSTRTSRSSPIPPWAARRASHRTC